MYSRRRKEHTISSWTAIGAVQTDPVKRKGGGNGNDVGCLKIRTKVEDFFAVDR